MGFKKEPLKITTTRGGPVVLAFGEPNKEMSNEMQEFKVEYVLELQWQD